jgi:hypothetical protein
MTYRLTNYATIIRLADNAYIPIDPNNADYITYQEWISAGGIPEEASPSITWEGIRDARNRKLAECDWVMLTDSPLSQEQKNLWISYRITLRDIPQTYNTPSEVIWPTKPN